MCSWYGGNVVSFIESAGIESVRTAYRSPWQNPLVERFIGILRRELLDHIVPLHERHLERLLKEFINDYYHPIRTHSRLDHEPPLAGTSVGKRRHPPNAELEPEPILGGLYTNYRAKAA